MNESLHGIKVAKEAPPITHLCFVDDSMLFSRANDNEAKTLSDILNTYAMESRQRINTNKSGVIRGYGVEDEELHKICSILNFQKWDNPGKYLGVPAI